ncbi:hypothetical protein D3C85_1611920 [compost metagenome]
MKAACTRCFRSAGRSVRQTVGDSGIGSERQTSTRSSRLARPLAIAASRMRSAMAAASTFLFCTAMALESCEPEKMTRPKSLSVLKPAFIRPALGNR